MDKTYTVPAHCDNCGHDFDAQIPFGEQVPSKMKCPRCGCPTAERRRTALKPAYVYPSATPPWPDRRPLEPRHICVYHRPAWMADQFMRQAG